MDFVEKYTNEHVFCFICFFFWMTGVKLYVVEILSDLALFYILVTGNLLNSRILFWSIISSSPRIISVWSLASPICILNIKLWLPDASDIHASQYSKFGVIERVMYVCICSLSFTFFYASLSVLGKIVWLIVQHYDDFLEILNGFSRFQHSSKPFPFQDSHIQENCSYS